MNALALLLVIIAAQYAAAAPAAPSAQERLAVDFMAAHSTTLEVGQSVAVRALIVGRYTHVIFVLVCNSTECSAMAIQSHEYDTSNSLPSIYATGCAWPWDEHDCRNESTLIENTLNAYNPGIYSLVLERRSSQLAVWQAGRPDNARLIDAPEGGSIVRVSANGFAIFSFEASDDVQPTLATPEELTTFATNEEYATVL